MKHIKSAKSAAFEFSVGLAVLAILALFVVLDLFAGKRR